MQIQDWIAGFAGGLMIGAAAAWYLLGHGRVMGASGILGGLIDGSGWRDWRGRAAFLVGLIAVPAALVAGGLGTPSAMVAGTVPLIVAGLLVGTGTRLGNGCTSGHGVCGMARLSPRSMVATAVFLVAGVVGVIGARALGWGA